MTHFRDDRSYHRSAWERLKTLCAIMIMMEIALIQPIYYVILNALGPSTEYYEPRILGEVERAPDGKFLTYIGDRIWITYIVVRHKINGNCHLVIQRYGEEIGGPRAGTRHLLDRAELQFVGENELRRPKWPIEGLVIGVDKNGMELLAPGVDEQEYALYVVAKYHCNYMDRLADRIGHARYLQGGEQKNETERVNLIIRRARE